MSRWFENNSNRNDNQRNNRSNTNSSSNAGGRNQNTRRTFAGYLRGGSSSTNNRRSRAADDPSYQTANESQTLADRTADSSFVQAYADQTSQRSIKQQTKCKFKRPAAGLFVSIGFILSFLSLLDCRFVNVDIGFVPENSTVRGKSSIAVGLWSMEDPNNSRLCLMPGPTTTKAGGLTDGDDLLKNLLFNGDANWVGARFMSLFGILFGFSDVIFTFLAICTDVTPEFSRKLQYVLYFSLFAGCCEGIKFGLFFNSSPCGRDLWQETINGEAILFRANQCLMDRATFLCMSSIICYFLLIILAGASLIFPDYHHSNASTRSIEQDFDDVSMPSFLQSIGESIGSKFSKNSKNSYGSSLSSKADMSTSTPSNDQVMAPIMEDEYH